MDYPISYINFFNTDCPLYSIFVAVMDFSLFLELFAPKSYGSLDFLCSNAFVRFLFQYMLDS